MFYLSLLQTPPQSQAQPPTQDSPETLDHRTNRQSITLKHKSERFSENTTVQSGNQQEDDELQADIAAAIALSLKDQNSAQVRENAIDQGIENLNL